MTSYKEIVKWKGRNVDLTGFRNFISVAVGFNSLNLSYALFIKDTVEVEYNTGDKENQAPVVQRLDNAIHRINHYPTDSVVCFVNTYLLDSDLSGG